MLACVDLFIPFWSMLLLSVNMLSRRVALRLTQIYEKLMLLAAESDLPRICHGQWWRPS